MSYYITVNGKEYVEVFYAAAEMTKMANGALGIAADMVAAWPRLPKEEMEQLAQAIRQLQDEEGGLDKAAK